MESVKNEFQGFGDDFKGFPKHLPDDCVEYTLFVVDPKLKSQKEVLARLEAVRKESKKLTTSLLKGYIWQRDGFDLKVESKNGRTYLHGLTNYGDSAEDEWLVVYILKELSKQFPELWIKTTDTDGEFLLIEAANALPRWLNPEIADNRVWIHHNALRIIPLSAGSTPSSQTAPVSRALSLEEALETVSSIPETLIHSPLIEAEAFYRLRNYPSQITASLHNAPITIPRKLAYILHDRPASIAPAVEAFYLRDPIALKALQAASSDLIFVPKDLVTVSTRFTKVLYAQLKSQQFSAPAAWKGIVTDTGDANVGSELPSTNRQAQVEMGMKVTSGFEMLLADPNNGDNRLVREIKIVLSDLATDPDVDLPSDQEIANWDDVTRADDETWLDINYEAFEKELQGQTQDSTPTDIPGAFGPDRPPNFGDAKTETDLKKMVQRFEAFLNDESAGVDGAEVDEMDVADDEDTDEEDSEEEDKEVSFNEEEFAKMMREMMGLPSEEAEEATEAVPSLPSQNKGSGRRVEELDSDEDEDDEDAQIRKVMQRMESELNEEGALNLDPTPKKLTALRGKAHDNASSAPGRDSSESHHGGRTNERDQDDQSDEEIDIDFNLAKNLLESFKSQAGMAGPGGNLMGMMGMRLPRDEDDDTTAEKKI